VPSLVVGLGYLGAPLAARLLERGHDVIALENGFSTDFGMLERLVAQARGRLRLLCGDVRDRDAVERAFAAARPVDTVFLLAAQASVHPAAAAAEYTEETNLRGPRLVFDAALRHGAPPIVYGSSFHVYGSDLAGDVDERHPYGPMRDLAHLSKIYVEKLAEMYGREWGLRVAPVRLGIVYGVGPVMKRDRRFVTVPHAFCLRALAGEALEVHPSGRRPAAYVHLDDAVGALALAEPDAGYAPANAASEVATAEEVAGLVVEAARARGIDARVHVTPVEGGGGAGPAPLAEVPSRRAVPGRTPFRVVSRLGARGWRPRPRLAASVPEILDCYARGAGGADHRAATECGSWTA
jgi:nucleoside-diphosphate-sugar epimerase